MNPITAARIRRLLNEWHAACDAAGYFRVNGPADEYKAAVESAHAAHRRYEEAAYAARD